ncbi:MAG: hypothetical protein GXP00_07270 [Alphaproteobacteria bacterium]|nr:hypothetical protein [Alphaproteobacteria bacterium]
MINLKYYLKYLYLLCGFFAVQTASAEDIDLQSLIDQSYNNLTSFKSGDKPPAPRIDLKQDSIFAAAQKATLSRKDILLADDIYDLHAIVAYLTARKMIAYQQTNPEINITIPRKSTENLLVGVATLAAMLAADDNYNYNRPNDRNDLGNLNRYPDTVMSLPESKTVRVPLKRHNSQIDRLAITLLTRAGICPSHYKDIMEKVYFSDTTNPPVTWQRLEEIDLNLKPKDNCDQDFAPLNDKFLKAKQSLLK